MELSEKKGVQHIVFALEKLGLKEVIVCPGSRNSPFVISFNRHPEFRCTSIRDERSAAFYALGKAIALKEPVAVLCTSGSAALNFAPAVAEAYYQRIPLIVLTADRPKEWIDQGDGQTINQTNIYHNYIRKSYDLRGEVRSQIDIWYNNRCLSEGFATALHKNKGPVHFNIPLHEPLYETEKVESSSSQVFFEQETKITLSEMSVKEFSTQFCNTKKVLILVGQHPKDLILQKSLAQMAAFENVVVLTESTSNIHHEDFVGTIDRCITHLQDKEAEELMPELLITLGGAVVSKRIKSFLRRAKLRYHWNIHPYESNMDTYQALTHAVSMKPGEFLSQVYTQVKNIPSEYRKKWQILKTVLEERHHKFCQQSEYSDFYFFQELYRTIPQNTTLHLSNSSPIRYAQLFDNQKIYETWCNRGTSGIDGCTSTVMGAAAALPQRDFLLVTGDVAFYYDVNALWNEEDIENLKIVIINNGGGSIFRIIPGPDKVEERRKYLETAMKSDAEKIAEHYGWSYLPVRDETELKRTLPVFFQKSSKRVILELFTDAEKNPEVLKQYWKYLKGNK